ncbi:MAG: heavy metal translocating P-type ATPase [Bryobacteraceae bacterium]
MSRLQEQQEAKRQNVGGAGALERHTPAKSVAPSSGWSKETYIALFAVTAIAIHLLSRHGFEVSPDVASLPLLATLAIGGGPLVWDLLRKALRKEFGSDLLAGISIAASVALGEYLAGSVIVLMLSGGSALENYATRRASAVLEALAKRMPRIAHRVIDGGLADVDLDDVRVGDRIVVFPHEICPVDGTVLGGRGTMDEAYLTGEPFLIAKVPGADVLSGAVNGESALEIEALKLPVDSRYAKIMQVMQAAEANRPRMRRIADRLGAWYTVVGLAVAVLGWFIGKDPTRFLAVLVIATPCPLLLAIPVAIIGAISVAASRGIIIKNPIALERIDTCRTVIFDKTGTLTYGKPALTDILCAANMDRATVLKLAASLEQYSKHPLAASVLEAARAENVTLVPASEISEKPGHGLNGHIHNLWVQVTGRKAVLAAGGDAAKALPPPVLGMECVVLIDGEFAAALRFHDTPRQESSAFVGHLAPHHNVKKVMLVSGDREAEVRYLAGEVGISDILFGKSPEEKVEIVREESAKGPTLFLGDGINDAPAMQAATVGVAFGQGSDITAEAADAVVMETSLGRVDELIHIGRRMRRIGLQSAVGGMALSMIGMGFAAAGLLSPVAGAVTQEVIDFVAVVNALRATLPAKDLRDEGI